jgi:YD repeat-containing protein
MINSSVSGRQEITSSSGDGSQIKTLYDGFGNMTEIRSFYGEQLVRVVIVRTALDGQKFATAYDRYGQAFGISASLIQNALIVPSREIAKTLGIVDRPKPVQPVIQDPLEIELAGADQTNERTTERSTDELIASPEQNPPKVMIGSSRGDDSNAENLRKKLQDLSLSGQPR